MTEQPHTTERFRIDSDPPSRPISPGRTLLAVLLAACPGPLAAAVVWPLLADRWKPLAFGILAGTSLFSIALTAGAGWLVRRVPRPDPDHDLDPDDRREEFRR